MTRQTEDEIWREQCQREDDAYDRWLDREMGCTPKETAPQRCHGCGLWLPPERMVNGQCCADCWTSKITPESMT